MRGGTIVILVFLASDESKSSQRIGMLDTRHEKPWEQGAGRRAMMITQPRDPRVPHWLPVLENRQKHLEMGRKCRPRYSKRG